ncbi:relaxase/mobilization nuclease domain-containing protein [Antarcticibacterium sp. 1MA-6-2]|uniref:relaxase/mobilization nuclease domain-containing protein n=1 Tax=Antarcticibacterium sp. 1MA-6-2 TaxID=2908210 RepID=UPI001F19FB9F|nr:relaxase/mobilization nuclease domain-containing protein [Antarcticibacterium sp. 1MA-6-2]UJH90553.1 relaxase/mobilization nuclease domain-containing protein [Antarcticibacterium sp. 1MA-6-2]
MIGKGHSISRTGASIAYGWNQEKEAEVVLKEYLAGDTPEEITEEFKIIQSQNQRCINNTLSFVVSPTIEDGKNLSRKDLGEVARRFLQEMKLTNHQAIAFVHRDKQHTHIHIYVNRISLTGEVYKDNFIGKRSQLAADKVAKELGLTRVREVQKEKLQELNGIRQEIRKIHEKVLGSRPKSLDSYIRQMQEHKVKVIPTINKSNELQGFRFEYKGVNLKASEVHRNMSGNRLIAEISRNRSWTRSIEAPKSLQILDKTVQLSASLTTKIGKELIKGVIKRALDTGIGI